MSPRRNALALLLAGALAVPAAAQDGPPAAPPAKPFTVADARASMIGKWTGQLEYRDYQANEWFGLAMKATIADGGDGVTQLRIADFDDGPKVGNVRITSLAMLGADGATQYSTAFRKNRVPEVEKAVLSLTPTAATDAAHWTLVALSEGTDDDRPARIRETTARDGAKMVTLKEVDFTDDKAEEWLTRNRTTLEWVGD